MSICLSVWDIEVSGIEANVSDFDWTKFFDFSSSVYESCFGWRGPWVAPRVTTIVERCPKWPKLAKMGQNDMFGEKIAKSV